MEEHRPKTLLDQVRDAIRLKHYSYRTEQAYVGCLLQTDKSCLILLKQPQKALQSRERAKVY